MIGHLPLNIGEPMDDHGKDLPIDNARQSNYYVV